MINQKLLFHVIVYERNLNQFVSLADKSILEEIIHYWCQKNDLRLECVAVQPDHLHLVIEQKNVISIHRLMSQLAAELQKCSIINSDNPQADFRGQLTFAIFSVSFPLLERLVNFVESQSDHHRSVSFEEEFTSLVDRNHVDQWKLPNQKSFFDSQRNAQTA